MGSGEVPGIIVSPPLNTDTGIKQYLALGNSYTIDQFNHINKGVSGILKVNYLDVTPDSSKALNNGSMVAADSLHLSGMMYRLWAEKLAPMINSNLD